MKRDVPAHYDVAGAGYAVVTLHRPANVDDPAVLRELLETLDQIGRKLTVLFPVHPRTRERVHTLGFQRDRGGGLRLLEPLGYLDMLGLVAGAQLVITDSGGLQEETTFLGVPCVTVRPNTERPVTCTHGTNRLVAPRRDVMLNAVDRAVARRSPARPVSEQLVSKQTAMEQWRRLGQHSRGAATPTAPRGRPAPAARRELSRGLGCCSGAATRTSRGEERISR